MIVLIPAYQPDERLLTLIDELREQTDYDIVVVNDGSDADREPLFDRLAAPVTVLHHLQNRGKGSAIKTGLQYIAERQLQPDAVVIADADGQHAVKDIIAVGREAQAHPQALVLGSRKLQGEIPWRSRMGNGITRKVFTLFTGRRLDDTQTGLRAFGVGLIPTLLQFPGERYEYEMNMLLGCVELRIPIREVPIAVIYHDRNNSGSHFRYFKDSARIYGCIIKFAGASFISFGVDYTAFLLLLWITGRVGLASALAVSNVLARIISAGVNYSLNRRFVFRSSDGLAPSLGKYILLAGGILLVNTLLLKLLTDTLLIPAALSKPVVELTLFGVSLLAQRLFVFKHSHLVSARKRPVCQGLGDRV